MELMWCRFPMLVFFMLLCFRSDAVTDPMEVMALQDMYRALNFPSLLKGWKAYSGDPCEEQWAGISCSGSTVLHIDIHGMTLGGYLGNQLSNLRNLKHLDASGNNIAGEIPFSLPPNASHINLSSNKFALNIPHSLASLRNLRHLNLSHNTLSGPLGNVFTGLSSLREMDLSYNHFSWDLPDSFSSLKNLTKLYLQNNNFTGSVILLANLQLTDLNIQDNHFSGIIPEHFQTIPNLWIGGNSFHTEANYPPWKFPLENIPPEQNFSSHPTVESSAIEHYPPLKMDMLMHKKKVLGPVLIAPLVGGIALLATCAAFVLYVHIKRDRMSKNEDAASTDSSLYSFPASSNIVVDYPIASLVESPRTLIVDIPTPPATMPQHLPPIIPILGRASRSSFSRKCKMAPSAKLYSVSEIQFATNNFSEENLLGEGSLGPVYRAEFPDGQVLSVKNVNTVSLSLHEEDQFLDVIRIASRLRHPNIVGLTGYCIEHGNHLLLYEYVRNLNLDDALHCESYMPLTWGLRLQIAFGIAQALEYMHCLSPPVAHCNLKARNVLLDDDLTPHLCDSGLGGLRPLTSNSVKLKASEIALSNSGYIAPEQGQAGTENAKTDVYAFGVLLLELLTGRKPTDSSIPGAEKCLAKWAATKLHDVDHLEDMIDPRIKIGPRALSSFADIISLCIQPEKEFRPSMSQVVEDLAQLQPKSGISGFDGDVLDKSFRSTQTRFPTSPTVSYLSV